MIRVSLVVDLDSLGQDYLWDFRRFVVILTTPKVDTSKFLFNSLPLCPVITAPFGNTLRDGIRC